VQSDTRVVSDDTGLSFPDGYHSDGKSKTCDCPTGCCDATGSCQPGDTDGVCGTGGGTCEDCAAGGKVCHGGTCKVCDRWSAILPGPMRAVEVAGDGTIYTAGNDKDRAFFVALDPCGTVKTTVNHLPATATKVWVQGLALAGGLLYATGTLVPKTGGDPQNGMWARITTPDLTVEWMKGLTGGTGKDEVWDIVHAGGALWMSGTADFEGEPTVWGVKGQGETACGFSWLGEGLGRGRGIFAENTNVYFTGAFAGKGFVGRQDDTACVVSPCAPCTAPWSVTFQDGTNSTEGRALLISGNDAYVAGFSSVGTEDHQFAVFRIDLSTGKTLGTFTLNPTSQSDLLLAMDGDGKALYVSGVEGHPAAPKAVVIKLTMPDLAKQWVRTPEAGGYWDVKLAGTDGLLLVGDTGSGGVVRRCLTNGTCP